MAITENTDTTAKGPSTPRRDEFRWTLASGLIQSPVSKGIGSEYLKKLVEKLNEHFSKTAQSFSLRTIILDNTEEKALAFSVVVVCLTSAEIDPMSVSNFSILIEATGNRISPNYINIGNTQVKITRVTAEAFDGYLVRRIEEATRAYYPNFQQIESAGGMVVPEEFSIDDDAKIHELAQIIGLACVTELYTSRTGFRDINLAYLESNSNPVVNLSFNKQQIIGVDNLPIRSDIIGELVTQQITNGGSRSRDVNDRSRDTVVAQFTGFIDLMHTPVQTLYDPYQRTAVPVTQKFAARAVITNISSNISYSPAAVLLALLNVLTLNDDSNWMQTFRSIASGEVSLHDIGALNIEGNIENNPSGYSERYDTSAEKFKLADLGVLLSTLVRPGLTISMDVPSYGPSSWYTEFLSAGESGIQNAYDLIYDSAEMLTNGEFSKTFARGMPIFTDVNNIIHLGYWYDRSGVRRDIRDFDYLAVANLLGSKNPAIMRDWVNTFAQLDVPLEIRLQNREKMIFGMSNETAVIKSLGRRITFTSKFLSDFGAGAKRAGYGFRANSPLSAGEILQQRPTFAFVESSALQSGTNFSVPSFYNVPGGGYGPQGAMHRYNR